MEIKSSEKQVIRVLFLPSAANGTHSLSAEKELQEITQRISSGNPVEIIDRQVLKPDDVLQSILTLKPHIVHFSGLGENQDAIYFKSDRGDAKVIPSEALASLFKLSTDYVKCVLINKCFSEKQATAISQYVPVVIGIKKETSDNAAVKFSTAFYTSLNPDLSYKNLVMAFQSSCIAIRFEDQSEQSNPVLIEGAPDVRFRSELDLAFLSVSQPKGLAFEALKKGLVLTGKKMGVPDAIVSKLLEEKIIKLESHNNSVLEYERYLKDILRDEYPLSELSNMALQKLQDGLDLTNEDAAVIKNKILNDPKLSSAESWYDRGRGQTELNNDEKAIEYFTKAIEKDPDYSAAYYERGYCYDRIGKFDWAVTDFSTAIAYNNKWEVVSNLTLAYYSRARAYHAMRSEDENKEKEYLQLSLADWNKTLELNPKQSEAYYGRGLVYEKLNMLNEAIADFNRSYEMSTTEDRKRNSVIYLAKAYYALGNTEEATKWMKLLKGENYNVLEESEVEKV